MSKDLVREPAGTEQVGASQATEELKPSQEDLSALRPEGIEAPSAAEPAPQRAPTTQPSEDKVSKLEAELTSLKQQMASGKISPEEAAKKAEKVEFKLWEMTEALADEPVKGGADTVKFFNEMANAIRRETAQMVLAKIYQDFGPMYSLYQRQAREQARQEFGKKYPDLVDDLDLAEETANEIVSKGVPFTSQEELFDLTAKATRARITRYRGESQQAVRPASAAPAERPGVRAPAKGPASAVEDEMRAVAGMRD